MCRKRDAILLAKTMVKIGKGMGRKMVALITNMDQPLGRAVGNSLEVEETILSLKGRGPKDLRELTLILGAQMLILAQRTKSLQEGKRILEEKLKSGEALAKFRSLIEEQGGDPRIIDNPNLLPQAKYTLTVSSPENGYVQRINCLEIGLSAVDLGAGRKKMDDLIDPGVGILIEKKVGERVKKGEPLALVRTNDLEKGRGMEVRIREAYTLGPKKKKAPPLIFKVIGGKQHKI